MVQEHGEESKYGWKVTGRCDRGLCGAAYYPKTFLGDIGCHLDLFLYDLVRFSYLFYLILAIINAVYQGVC